MGKKCVSFDLLSLDHFLWIGFLNDLFYDRSYIAASAELSIPFLLDEKSTVVPVRLAGEQSGGKRKREWARGSDQRKVFRPTGTMRRFKTSGLSASSSPMGRDRWNGLSVRAARWAEGVAVGNLNVVEKMKSEKRGAHRELIS